MAGERSLRPSPAPPSALAVARPHSTPAGTPVQRREDGPRAPQPSGPALPLSTRETHPPSGYDSAAAAVEAGVAHWDDDGSVVFHTPGDAEIQPVQRTLGDPGPMAGPAETWTPDVPVVSRFTTPGPPGAGPAGWPEGLDWNELVHRLHEDIRWELRAELRRDAGRFGFRSGVD